MKALLRVRKEQEDFNGVLPDTLFVEISDTVKVMILELQGVVKKEGVDSISITHNHYSLWMDECLEVQEGDEEVNFITADQEGLSKTRVRGDSITIHKDSIHFEGYCKDSGATMATSAIPTMHLLTCKGLVETDMGELLPLGNMKVTGSEGDKVFSVKADIFPLPVTLNNAAYVAHKGLKCPKCCAGSVSPKPGFHRTNINRVFTQVECLTCGSTWEDQYDLKQYNNLKPGTKPKGL